MGLSANAGGGSQLAAQTQAAPSHTAELPPSSRERQDASHATKQLCQTQTQTQEAFV
eukprot:m.22663 g.22663  ORF g.22663 m.22663 type:complete len:57 (+) comp9352_c0_seq1:124-294(+)